MQVLLVLAHPSPSSFNHAIAEHARQALTGVGHEVQLLDLYAIGVTAAMSADEHAAYHTDQPLLDPMLRHHAELLGATDALIFVYPTWWSGMPAVLKGWLERLMVPGVAFKFRSDGRVRGAMGNVRHLIGISTYGSPRRYVRLINDNGRRTLLRTLRLNTGLRTRSDWLGLYAIDTATEQQRRDFLDAVARRMREL